MNIAEWIYETGLARAFRTTGWLYAALLSSHVAAIAMLAGSTVTLAIVARRSDRGRSLVEGQRPPALWTGVAAAAVAAGLLLFVTNPFAYVGNPVFLTKMPLVAASLILSWIGLTRGRFVASTGLFVASLFSWVATIAAGRLIAFF